MDGLTINIPWEFFIGIMGSLIAIAWYSGSRFSSIETNIANLTAGITNLTGRVDDAFKNASPISLTKKGEEILAHSGLKIYIDSEFNNLHKNCSSNGKFETAYDIQEKAFAFMDSFRFPDEIEKKIKDAAYSAGTTIDTVRRVGGIYFRDKCLEKSKIDPKLLDSTR